MAIKTQHVLSHPTWFITFTCYRWLPLFDAGNAYDLVYNWLKFIEVKYKAKPLAFVIMPNNVHVLLYFGNLTLNLNTLMSNGKRFMAYEQVKRLQQKDEKDLLYLLSSACTEKEKAKGQLHKAFEPSFDAKPVYSLSFLQQKLDYIHHNPVKGKWNLCNEYTDYAHSSAAYYTDGLPHTSIAIADYRNYW